MTEQIENLHQPKPFLFALHRLVFLLLAMVLLSACDIIATETPAPDTIPGASSDWLPIAPGMDYRRQGVRVDNTDFDMHIVRIDPSMARFRVFYEPGNSYTYTAWKNRLPDNPQVFINANFFTEDDSPIGLVVSDGQSYGISLNGYGGMFQVEANGMARVRSLVLNPYIGENYTQAVQAFPMMIEPSGRPASTGSGFDDPARRSVIAQDIEGNIYLMSTGVLGQISLRNLQQWLLASPYNLDVAFALDGGRSAMLFANTNTPLEIPAFSSVPVVLAVYESE